MSKLTDAFHKAHASTFGWKSGDDALYSYRSAKSPKGVVTAVHPGTTRKNATVTIEPAPKFRFGEGKITRHVDKISHTTIGAADRVPVKKKAK